MSNIHHASTPSTPQWSDAELQGNLSNIASGKTVWLRTDLAPTDTKCKGFLGKIKAFFSPAENKTKTPDLTQAKQMLENVQQQVSNSEDPELKNTYILAVQKFNETSPHKVAIASKILVATSDFQKRQALTKATNAQQALQKERILSHSISPSEQKSTPKIRAQLLATAQREPPEKQIEFLESTAKKFEEELETLKQDTLAIQKKIDTKNKLEQDLEHTLDKATKAQLTLQEATYITKGFNPPKAKESIRQQLSSQVLKKPPEEQIKLLELTTKTFEDELEILKKNYLQDTLTKNPTQQDKIAKVLIDKNPIDQLKELQKINEKTRAQEVAADAKKQAATRKSQNKVEASPESTPPKPITQPTPIQPPRPRSAPTIQEPRFKHDTTVEQARLQKNKQEENQKLEEALVIAYSELLELKEETSSRIRGKTPEDIILQRITTKQNENPNLQQLDILKAVQADLKAETERIFNETLAKAIATRKELKKAQNPTVSESDEKIKIQIFRETVPISISTSTESRGKRLIALIKQDNEKIQKLKGK
ncbi:MAG: hypothetical protein P4L16_07180 [Chlamydiales bacterium]|nr:hypothetical protein [Chlamydiales bacterium]